MDPLVTIRPMLPHDWPMVRRIYQEGIGTGIATFETDPPDWPDFHAGHHPFGRLVADDRGTILGWVTLAPTSRRECYAGVAELSVYVTTRCRRLGIGRRLVRAAIEAAEANDIWTITAGVIAENEASRRLFASMGFREIGRRERIARIQRTWHDTVLFELRLNTEGDAGFQELRSRRLILRRFREGDSVALHVYRIKPSVVEFQSWQCFTGYHAHQFIHDLALIHPDTPGRHYDLAITLAGDGRLIGDCGFSPCREAPGMSELSITIDPAHGGQGLGTEAMRTLVEYLFQRRGKRVLIARTLANNERCIRLFRRVGFRIEAHLPRGIDYKGSLVDGVRLALSSEEWATLHQEQKHELVGQ